MPDSVDESQLPRNATNTASDEGQFIIYDRVIYRNQVPVAIPLGHNIVHTSGLCQSSFFLASATADLLSDGTKALNRLKKNKARSHMI